MMTNICGDSVMMNKPIPIAKDIYWIGVNDLETHLFEAIWPLPQGVCYNSYLIDDEKVALAGNNDDL